MQILTTATVQANPHCLVYGAAKSGKTRLIPTCPNPFVCSTDDGLSSIRSFNVPYCDVRNWAQAQEFIRWAVESKESKQFQTLIIDDLTELAEQFLFQEKPKHKNLMQAYGALNDEMMRIIRVLREVRERFVVLLCKQERIQDQNGALIYSPMIPGKAVAPMLPYLVGEVYHTEIWVDPASKAEHEVLRTKRNSTCEAGSRSGKLGELEMAHLGNIFAKVTS